MPGIRPLRKGIWGPETTAGTAVAGTRIRHGRGTIQDLREVVFPEEDIGIIPGTDRSYTPKYGAEIEWNVDDISYDEIIWPCEGGVKAVGTGVADGVGSGKIYTYALPSTAKNSVKTFTIEGGDDQEAEEMEYSFLREWELSGKMGEALASKEKWFGRQVTVSSFTGGASLADVKSILMGNMKVYRDAVGGPIGTTQLTNSVIEFKRKLKTGWLPVFTADGQLYFNFAKLVMPELEYEVTFEHDAVGAARKVDWRAETTALYRFQWEGPNLTTPGTTYSKYTYREDAALKVKKVEKLDEVDGNDVLKATFWARYNATAALYATFLAVNQLASLP